MKDTVFFHSNRYRIETDVYQGPLDLLLSLIEKAELDITVLSLAQVTDQFLAYVERMKEDDPAEVSAFLVIAARLVQIKSGALLPKSPVETQGLDEDSGEMLARQLIMYRRFRQLADNLAEREEQGLRSHLRAVTPDPGVEPALDTSDLDGEKLSALASIVFAVRKELPSLNTMMKKPRLTIHEKIRLLVTRLKERGQVRFSSLLQSGSKEESVVTFLAMLELIKQKSVQAEQDSNFAEIHITALEDGKLPETFVSEFGD